MAFSMGSSGPQAISRDKKASAYLDFNFKAPDKVHRETELCGEEEPDLAELEIYHL